MKVNKIGFFLLTLRIMKRREFLKAAGLAGAGLAATGAGLSSCTGMGSGNAPKPYHVNTAGGARMKLSWEPYELQLRHVFTVASYSRTTTPDVQVKIEYDGFTGYGEASMPQYLGQSVESVTTFLKKVNLEQFSDPFQLEDILDYVDSINEGDTAAKAAVDIALHDLVGKLMGEPWYRIWGLNPAKTPNTTFTIGIDTPEIVKAKTEECKGKFKILKAKVGVEGDRQTIEAIRSVTDVPLAVDANQGWKDKYKALDEIGWLQDHGVVMVEQPMPKEQIDDIAWLRERTELPIYADEAVQRLKDIPALKGAYDGINIKLMKCTGMREAWRMASYAKAEGMKVMIGCMTETSCAVSAAAQLSPVADFADLDGNLLISNDLFTGMTVENGKICLPDRPGIGILPLE